MGVNVMNKQTIYIINETETQIPTRADVYDIIRETTSRLFCDHEMVMLYVTIVDNVPSNKYPTANGCCCMMIDNPHTYIVYIRHTPINGDIWPWVLKHELYHVFQHENQLPLNERECNQFANMNEMEIL